MVRSPLLHMHMLMRRRRRRRRLSAAATSHRRRSRAAQAGGAGADPGLQDSLLETPTMYLSLFFFIFVTLSSIFEIAVHAHLAKMGATFTPKPRIIDAGFPPSDVFKRYDVARAKLAAKPNPAAAEVKDGGG